MTCRNHLQVTRIGVILRGENNQLSITNSGNKLKSQEEVLGPLTSNQVYYLLIIAHE